MRTIIGIIDAISEWTGRIGSWFGVALVGVVTYEVMMRYLFNAPSLWAYEVSVMLGASLYILAFAYTHLHQAHVRVDMIYAHLPPRGKAIIDVLGDIFLFSPFIILLVLNAWDWMWYAWETGERMPITGWYPPAGPLRTIVMLGLALFALQGMAQLVRDFYLLIRNKAL
ncbi:MAG TPA: TRAP transporter small permease subunit [Dehalococcoidia bacterium]|jgi:TRAP-type mannitol/chloroaromatic compound transport system permease small subunit|nr:TRAP transporter small permease subunit [Dehalococcoidia bacterium]